MQKIEIRSFPVELYKVLQIAGWVDTGGMAKVLIAEGEVTLNGEVELRKRRKCNSGDAIGLGDEVGVLELEYQS